jgi:hypothetical protein
MVEEKFFSVKRILSYWIKKPNYSNANIKIKKLSFLFDVGIHLTYKFIISDTNRKK